jgi:hypothetical protein
MGLMAHVPDQCENKMTRAVYCLLPFAVRIRGSHGRRDDKCID